MSHSITLDWVGGEHSFALTIGGLRAVQEICGAGPMEILNGLRLGTWRVDWPLAVIRHGLVGGGMEGLAAKKLIDSLAEIHPLAKFQVPAAIIMAAALVGVEDDPVGEEAGELNPPPNGSSAGSTPTAQKPDSHQGKSI